MALRTGADQAETLAAGQPRIAQLAEVHQRCRRLARAAAPRISEDNSSIRSGPLIGYIGSTIMSVHDLAAMQSWKIWCGAPSVSADLDNRK